MEDMGPLGKNKKNVQQGYTFRGIEDLMNEFAPLATKHGIFPVTTAISDVANEPVTSKAGATGYRTVRRFTFRFYAEDGSFVETTADGEAIDYGDKSSNKAYSVAYREAIYKMFVVPFADDDIENHDHDLKAPEQPKTAPTPFKKPPVYKSTDTKEIEAKKRIAMLCEKLSDIVPEKPDAKWFGDRVQELTGHSLELASLEELENIGDSLGKLYDTKE
jgi:hypothetical protein